MTLDALEKLDNPSREVAKICQQVRAEPSKGDLSRRKNEHHAEQQQVHQIDDHEREECALIAQVGLIFRDHPAGEREMERPGGADHGIQQAPIRLDIHKEAKHAIRGDRQNAVKREKIRRQRDPEICLVRDDVSAVATNTKPADTSSHQQNPQGVGEFVSEYIDYDWARQAEECDQPENCAQ